MFRTPNVAEYIIPAGGDGSGYVFAESIPEMERRGRLHERRGAQHSRRRSVSSKVTAVIAIVVLIGAVGFLIFMAGPGRDGSGPDQRPGSDESPVVTDLQAPTPRTTPSATNTPRLSPQLTAQVAQSSMATAIPTETPTATPTMHPSPTPELVPTATNTPTPSPPPTAKAVQASIATAIPTDTPVAIQTKLPTKTPTSTPVPTAVPQISPTPMSTTPSVTVLATFENGRWLIQNRPTLATSIVAIDWIEDGIEASESEAVQELVNLAAFHEMLTASLIDRPWFADGVTATELEGVKYLGYIAHDSEAAARQVAEMPWFVNGVTETEVEAIDNLAYIAQSSAAVAEYTVEMAWFVDGITETELEGIKYLGYIAENNGAAAEQIAKMPFLTAIEPVDVSAMKALADLAAEDAVDQVMAHTSLAQGITDGLTPVIAMLYGVAETNPSLTDRLLDPEGVNLERRSITLPLTGDIELVIVRTAPGAVRGMDLLEHSVRASEELMGKPLPTRYVGLLYEDAVIEGYAGTNFGTHIAILPKYDVDDGSHYAMSALGNIAHEVAHYYWSGNANWIDEGLAEFMTYAIESERTGEPIGVANAPCAYAPSIIELESLAPDPVANHEAFGCNYSLGVRLFVDMYRAMNENAIWERLRDLYNKSLMEDSADDLKVTALNIKHLRQVFHSDPGALVSIGRWYDRTEDYDLSQLDLRLSDPPLPSINGQIDEAYVNIGEDGPSVSSFSVDDVADQTVWLNLDYSYNITGGPHKLVLDLVEFYEDGFEFRRGSVEITAESQYIGGESSVSVGTDKWASGRYWVYLYDGDRKVADVQYEVTP